MLERGLPSLPSSDELATAEKATLDQVENLFQSWETNSGKKAVEIREAMGETLSRNVFVFRVESELQHALEDLKNLQKDFENLHLPNISSPDARKFNYGLVRTLELRNMIDIAEVTAFASLWRKESRGAHFRTDYPTRNDNDYLVHSMVLRNVTGDLEMHTKAVKLGIFEPKPREY